MSSNQRPLLAGHPGHPDSSLLAPKPGIYSTTNPEDPTRKKAKDFDFNETSIRFRFIKEVYLLLTHKFLSAILVVGLVFYLSQFMQIEPVLIWIAIGFMIFTIIFMFCCSSIIRRKPVVQFIFLFISIHAEGILAGAISTIHYGYECLFSFGITIVICFAFALLVFQSKLNFTGLRTINIVLYNGAVIFFIVLVSFDSQIRAIIFGSLGAMMFSFYFICDMQMMMNGKHKYLISPEEYLLATLNLYILILSIFSFIVSELPINLLMIEGKHTYSISPEEYVFATLNLYMDVIYIFCKGDSRPRG